MNGNNAKGKTGIMYCNPERFRDGEKLGRRMAAYKAALSRTLKKGGK